MAQRQVPPSKISETGKACFCVCPHTTRPEIKKETKECDGGECRESGDGNDKAGYCNVHRSGLLGRC
jgi:hypothetical protein